MTNPVVSQSQWLKARQELLVQEKAHTQERARLAALRAQLPWVKVAKDYQFSDATGPLKMADLFAGQHQLIVYHLMFGDGWDAPCIGCSQWADALSGTTQQFSKADARVIAISRAPFAQLAPVQQQRGWQFAWVSSAGSDFNLDYHASSNDLSDDHKIQVGLETMDFDRGENHGVSVFVRQDAGEIFHTYSSYNRGIEALNGALGYLDLLPGGRAW